MSYVYAPNGQVETFPYSIFQLKSDNPHISFPKTISDELLETYNVFPVTPAASPKNNSYNEKVVQVDPVLVNAQWVETYEVVEMTPEELAAETEIQETMVRAERDRLLKATDWTQLPDTPVDPEFYGPYRQSLRDIPTQAGFPWEVVWPDSPDGVTR